MAKKAFFLLSWFDKAFASFDILLVLQCFINVIFPCLSPIRLNAVVATHFFPRQIAIAEKVWGSLDGGMMTERAAALSAELHSAFRTH